MFLSANVVERVTIMNSTKNGNKYYEMEDVKEICGKCRFSYAGDWSIQDCSYCLLPKMIEEFRIQAEYLDKICDTFYDQADGYGSCRLPRRN